MRAEDKSFYFLATPSYYDIPFFQRAYVWSEENWSELLDNLSNKTGNHFLGSIILKNELAVAGSVARFAVIDGQQRLTTLSILLRACYDHIVKHRIQYGFTDDEINTCKVKMENLLFVPEGGIKQTLHVKINHSHLDKKAFESVIKGDLDKEDRWEKYIDISEEDNVSSIIRAYAYFRDELEDAGQETIDYLWELLTVDKIKFLVNIDLDVHDNEQAIFDTVNSAGVRLSSADTIKNLLYQKYVELLRLSDSSDVDADAVAEYENTWVDAFLPDENTNSYWETERQYGRMKRSYIETLLHSYAVIKGFFNPAENNMSDLPQEYRKRISKMSLEDLHGFLEELHDYAFVFKDYFSEEDNPLRFDDYVGRIFNVCNVLEVSTFYPYLLQQLYARKNDDITDDELKERFFYTEKYVILNAICRGSTKNYNNECRQLVEGKRTPQEIFETCIYISEGNFVNGLRRMTTNKLPTLLLFWVELYQRSMLSVDVKSLKYEYTLEHIMPQKWAQNWNDVPSYDMEGNVIEEADEIERTRSRAIYEIGNMTLLNSKLNTSISNGTFFDKINGKHGRKGIKDLADLRLTKEVINNNTEWNELKIYARSADIERQIREIWDANDLPAETVLKAKGAEGGRKELRLRFWEMALPIIKEKNGNESFANCTPTTSNMASGFFGMGGFSVVCTANYDKARVDFFLGKRNTEKNKEAFDILWNNKEDIENEVGVKLHWDRADDFKASWISYTLDNVSIANESDWDRMAEFLGEWSAKIRRAMVPLLTDSFPQDSSKGRSPEEVARLNNIADILKEWTMQRADIIACPERCTRSCTRFMTECMSTILPDVPGVLSSWGCENHYFYEIVNRSGTDVRIQLSFNSKNITEETRKRCNEISNVVSMKQAKPEWVWWKAFKTSKIAIPDDLDKNVIFDGLDAGISEVQSFEKKLKSDLGID